MTTEEWYNLLALVRPINVRIVNAVDLRVVQLHIKVLLLSTDPVTENTDNISTVSFLSERHVAHVASTNLPVLNATLCVCTQTIRLRAIHYQ